MGELGRSRNGLSMHVACSSGENFNDFDKPKVRCRLRDADQRDQPYQQQFDMPSIFTTLIQPVYEHFNLLFR